MSDQSLYDEDILLWSEQQAEAIRRLGRTGSIVPNDLDIENVAEEIESVGRSELAAVKSLIRQIFLHLMKLAVEPEADAVRHWTEEVHTFHAELLDRYAPSMRQRFDIDELWADTRERLLLLHQSTSEERFAVLPKASPVTLDGLVRKGIDVAALVAALRSSEEQARSR